jgi:uncharacterized protein DUF4932
MRWLLLVAFVAGCAPAPRPPLPSLRGNNSVHVDKRVELMSIVMRLAGAEEYGQAIASPYTTDVDATFKPFASHPAIAATKLLRERFGIAFDAPMHLAIHLDDQLQPRAVPDLVANDQRWRGVDVAAYAAKLRDFAEVAKLDLFMAKHALYYRRVEDAFRARVDAEDPAGWFDAMFGARTGARFVVVPGLLNGGANYGPRATVDGTLEMYQILGIYRADADGTPALDDETVATLIHEMAHSYINPVFDKHQADLAPAGRVIFPLVEKPMREQAYGDAVTMFDESGVRAITVMYLRDRHGAAAGVDAEVDEVRRSFVWTPELAQLFQRYREHRDRFPTLEAFMPDVVGFFDELATRYAQHGLPPQPFLGPIDAVFDDVSFSAPDTADAKVAGYVETIRKKVFPSAPRTPAGTRNLVAYGTPASNMYIQTFVAKTGIQLAADRIVLGTKTFTGAGLVLIACWSGFDDKRSGIAVYAAANDADLVGINSVRHGGTDWVVARKTDAGFQTLGMGDFPKTLDGRWGLP